MTFPAAIGTETTTQFAIILARVLDGAVVSITGCAAADEVPSLNEMWVDELGISVLVSPAFKGPRISDSRLHNPGRNLYLLTSIAAFGNEAMASTGGAFD